MSLKNTTEAPMPLAEDVDPALAAAQGIPTQLLEDTPDFLDGLADKISGSVVNGLQEIARRKDQAAEFLRTLSDRESRLKRESGKVEYLRALAVYHQVKKEHQEVELAWEDALRALHAPAARLKAADDRLREEFRKVHEVVQACGIVPHPMGGTNYPPDKIVVTDVKPATPPPRREWGGEFGKILFDEVRRLQRENKGF